MLFWGCDATRLETKRCCGIHVEAGGAIQVGRMHERLLLFMLRLIPVPQDVNTMDPSLRWEFCRYCLPHFHRAGHERGLALFRCLHETNPVAGPNTQQRGAPNVEVKSCLARKSCSAKSALWRTRLPLGRSACFENNKRWPLGVGLERQTLFGTLEFVDSKMLVSTIVVYLSHHLLAVSSAPGTWDHIR